MIRLAFAVLLVVFVLFLIHADLWQEHGEAEWFEFYLPWDDRSPSFTDLLTEEAPAGRYGFVHVGEDGHFYLGNGRRIRFWGVAIGHQALFPPKRVAEKLARRLAKFGFNLVRIDALDRYIFYDKAEDTQHFDPRKLDRFDYLVSQLEKYGIYISIIITVHRTFRANDGVIDWDNPNFHSPEGCIKYDNERLLRTMAVFDPYLNRLQREYAKELLMHRNPYTGNRYAEEPALAFLEIINETTLDYAWLRDQLNYDSTSPLKVTQYYSDELDALWNIWLLERYSSREKLAQAWSSPSKKGLLTDEDPARQTVRRILYSERAQFSEARVRDLQRFYHELQQQYFRGFYNFLRNELGVKVPISGTHTFHGMPNLAVQAPLDFTGVHTYWQHPILQPCKRWIESRISILNTPMVDSEIFQTPKVADWIETRNTLYRIAFGAAVSHKPLVVSEYNHPFPNEYQAEFPLIISAYGNFQDWDGIVIHSYMERLDDLNSNMITNGFTIFNNPVLMAQMPAASLLFRKGYVKTAVKTLTIPYTEDQTFTAFSKCGLDIHCVLRERGPDPHLALVHGVRNKFVSPPASLPSEKLANPYRSDTGELGWDIERGLVLIDTERVQAAVGFLTGGPIKLKNLTIDSATDFAAISLISLDGRPIAESKRLLLTAVARMKNSGMILERESGGNGLYQLKAQGKAPILAEVVHGWIRLQHDRPDQIKVFRLDRRGRLGSEIRPIPIEGDTISFAIGNNRTLWYALVSARD